MTSTSRPSVASAVAGRIDITPAKAAVAVKAFFRLATAWGLSVEEARALLGQPARATFFQWQNGRIGRVPFDTVRRISWLLGIWKALQILFPTAARADAWVRLPNQLLGGQAALDRMVGGDVADLAEVRAVLDYARGGGL